MLSYTLGGSTSKTANFLKGLSSGDPYSSLESLAQQGVAALQNATPQDSGLTAASWSYEIERSGSKTSISWLNTNNVGGVNVAVILQYGHGTGTGGYVAGRNYINPAIRPVMDRIADEVWRKVTNS